MTATAIRSNQAAASPYFRVRIFSRFCRNHARFLWNHISYTSSPVSVALLFPPLIWSVSVSFVALAPMRLNSSALRLFTYITDTILTLYFNFELVFYYIFMSENPRSLSIVEIYQLVNLTVYINFYANKSSKVNA